MKVAAERTFSVRLDGQQRTLSEQERADLIAGMRERSMTYGQIELKTGMSASNISWICLKYGIEKPGKKPKLGDRGPPVVKRDLVRRFTPDEDAVLLRMAIEGAGTSEIARAIGRKHNSILGRQMTLARRDERAEDA